MQNQIQNVFREATSFAERLGSKTVETEHLLYGVLCEENSIASKVPCKSSTLIIAISEPSFLL